MNDLDVRLNRREIVISAVLAVVFGMIAVACYGAHHTRAVAAAADRTAVLRIESAFMRNCLGITDNETGKVFDRGTCMRSWGELQADQ